MIVRHLISLGVFAVCAATRPPHRGGFAPVPNSSDTTLRLIEGDIALPPNLDGSTLALNTFLKSTKALWPRGRVPFRIDTEEWEVGVVEPVFLDSQIKNITIALQKIETGVPCIDFK